MLRSPCASTSRAAVVPASSTGSSSTRTGPRTIWRCDTDGVTLLVDPLSLQYLMGAEVDYTESLHGAQFVIRNPNAKTTCGCGSSLQHVMRAPADAYHACADAGSLAPPNSRRSFPAFAFAGEPLDRADRLRDDADALARLWPQARVIVLDADGNALADEDGRLLRTDRRGLSAGPAAPAPRSSSACMATRLVLAGCRADRLDRAATHRSAQRRRAHGRRSKPARSPTRARMQHWRSRAALLRRLRRRRRHSAAAAAWAVARQCGAEHYPRIDPAVIVAVSDGERLLLGRQSNWPARRYSVIAGFVEPGESLEQTVVREVFEETGVRVRSCRYLASQPWPFPGALMLGFIADAEADEPRVERRAGGRALVHRRGSAARRQAQAHGRG